MLDETRVEPFRNLFFRPRSANNSGVSKRQITDLVDQSMQINAHCFVVTADNRYILICGFWDKSFRVYSTETGEAPRAPPGARCHSQSFTRTHGEVGVLILGAEVRVSHSRGE